MYKLLLPLAVIFLYSCVLQKRQGTQTIRAITFLDEYNLPNRMPFRGTTVGGLSGIDYNKADNVFYLISDDRSDHNPARFYTARITIRNQRIDTIEVLKVDTLRQRNGQPFPNKSQAPGLVPDPEALRYNPHHRTMVWSSEGERIVRENNALLIHPSINVANKDGLLLDTFPIPANMRMTTGNKGPRQNGVFEGLTFTPDYKTLFVSTEEPLLEDGPRAGLRDTSGWIRIIRYDATTRQPVAQYAYQIDPVVQEPIAAGLFIVNGVPDILAINDHQLLVIERSFSTGRLTCNVRLYLAELKGADNIAGVASLQQTPIKNPVKKKLLLNMDHLGRWVDNVEGASFGPGLPKGRRSLLLVTDDNFSAAERTQFFLFSVE